MYGISMNTEQVTFSTYKSSLLQHYSQIHIMVPIEKAKSSHIHLLHLICTCIFLQIQFLNIVNSLGLVFSFGNVPKGCPIIWDDFGLTYLPMSDFVRYLDTYLFKRMSDFDPEIYLPDFSFFPPKSKTCTYVPLFSHLEMPILIDPTS